MPADFKFKNNRLQDQGRGVKTDRGTKTKRSLAPAQQFELDIYRGGRPSEIIALLERDDQKSPDDFVEPVDWDEADEMLDDSEVETFDEDEPQEDEDHDDEFLPSQPVVTPTPWQFDLSDRIAITVYKGVATFDVPEWALGHYKVDLELRWNTYRTLADWLNKERKEFLLSPSFLNLGLDSFDLAKPVPVLHKGLHAALGLGIVPTTFSKHCNHGVLLWSSAAMNLEDLWGQDAKLAWFAQAIIKRQRERGYLDRQCPLASPAIQPPRNQKEKEDFVKRSKSQADRLGPVDYVALLCILTGCSWRNVLDQYADEIFYQEKRP